jgi:uncharacterized protein DUF4350
MPVPDVNSRAGILLTVAAFAALLLVAALLGRQQRGVVDEDFRASTYVTGPSGTSALYEALPALGVSVRRLRDRRLPTSVPAPGRETFVIVSPTRPVTSEEARALLDDSAVTRLPNVVLAGSRTASLLRCFGYDIRVFPFDSSRASLSREADAAGAAPLKPFFTRAVLEPVLPGRNTTSESPFEPPRVDCPLLSVQVRVDTLVTSPKGAVAIRLTRSRDSGFVTIVADGGMFRNRGIRETAAGPFVLALLARGNERVVFDEYHQGFGPSGSLGRALASWSLRSPLGWGVWQATLVGLLALLASGIRFGRPLASPGRRRRASLEHVRALATALAAARGHDVAISVLLRGLRRRLAIKGRGKADEGGMEDEGGAEEERVATAATMGRDWLFALDERTMPARGREAVHALKELSKPGQDDAAVLRAANAVEDVWDTLRHSTPTGWRR